MLLISNLTVKNCFFFTFCKICFLGNFLKKCYFCIIINEAKA